MEVSLHYIQFKSFAFAHSEMLAPGSFANGLAALL